MRKNDMMQRMTDVAARASEPIMLQPLVELCGEKRLLIEHHMGIEEYSSKTVQVKVKFGSISVNGCNLEINCMTAEQLVITGNIEAISLQKGKMI